VTSDGAGGGCAARPSLIACVTLVGLSIVGLSIQFIHLTA
jgi:hypothetical protein